MTKEEAIEQLRLGSGLYEDVSEEYDEATDMAIEALEQEPCDDCISRQDALDCLTATGLKKFDFILDARDKIKNLPPVTPQPKTGHWIPVSERLPEKSGRYWCTFGGTNLTGIDHYTTESDAKEIFDDPEECTGWNSHNVVAWMQLPEPYKEVEQ